MYPSIRSSSNGSRSAAVRPEHPYGRSIIEGTPHTLIISDLHLQVGRPDITEQFFEFLAGPARGCRRLLILGDLFESWVGDDAVGRFELEVAERLNALARSGVTIEFLAGNRDFLLGDDYCRRAGMQRLEEPVHIHLAGRPTLLMHGDTLCTDDHAYQRLRRRVRDPSWQQRMLKRPVALRRLLAKLLRLASRIRTKGAAPHIMDVNAEAVRRTMIEAQTDYLIHGHTHRPAVHAERLEAGTGTRFVLGDWFDQGSVIEVDDHEIRLKTLRRS
jgi:UDP-2,3-diacylglucosamine hydrolase